MTSSGMPRLRDCGSMNQAPTMNPMAMNSPWGEIDSGPMWTRTIGLYEMTPSTSPCLARPRGQTGSGRRAGGVAGQLLVPLRPVPAGPGGRHPALRHAPAGVRIPEGHADVAGDDDG